MGAATWAALVPFAPPAGGDPDANGVVDPWEIHQEPEPTGPDPLCPEFVSDEPRYPIRPCQVGFSVVAVQVQLDERARHDYVNGFFDAATEAAVRAFQGDAGLPVDGLVDRDTWAALYTGQPAGTDRDGSGLVDPWELPIGDANSPESDPG